MKAKYYRVFLASILIIALTACTQSDYSPKPRGYFRIDLPEKQWMTYDSFQYYHFEYPHYAQVILDPFGNKQDEWANIVFPQFKAILHLSYKQIHNNLNVLTEESRSLSLQHLPKANSITDSLFYLPKNNSFGMIYQINGKGVASPIQFYLSDSTNHFIRGALYFNFRPNNDSTAPLINFLKNDILHFIQSVKWENQ